MPLIETMQKSNIAHNIFFRKGKAWIYPLVNELSGFNQSDIGIASMELSGHLILKTEDHLALTPSECRDLILAQALPMDKINDLLSEAFPTNYVIALRWQ